ncbi:hypothetical protein FS837_011571 [Tulasnella sp. UAMH 9824]|nr:hypothetical protein FS837_011571 [Tulasnella sp. UAMH 9824]
MVEKSPVEEKLAGRSTEFVSLRPCIGNGPINPIYGLALKNELANTTSNWEDIQFYDESASCDFNEAFTGSEKFRGLLSPRQHILQGQAETDPKPSQILLSSPVTEFNYSDSGVSVELTSGEELKATYAFVTFSVGMLHHPEDVTVELFLARVEAGDDRSDEDGHFRQADANVL